MNDPADRSLRLAVELVPSTAWWSNLRSNLSPSDWGKCKRFVRRRSGDRCELCGGRGPKWPVECHEIWAYDDATRVQTLAGLIALCPPCHESKHIGRAGAVGTSERARKRLMVANGWSDSDVDLYLEAMFEQWASRSRHPWSLDVSWLATIGITPPAIEDR